MNYPASEVRGGGRECQAATGQEQLKRANPRLSPGLVVERSNPTSKEQWLRGRGRAKRNYSMLKVRRGSCALLEQP